MISPPDGGAVSERSVHSSTVVLYPTVAIWRARLMIRYSPEVKRGLPPIFQLLPALHWRFLDLKRRNVGDRFSTSLRFARPCVSSILLHLPIRRQARAEAARNLETYSNKVGNVVNTSSLGEASLGRDGMLRDWLYRGL